VLYIGVTNSLSRRLKEHLNNTDSNSFAAKYNCNQLLYYEAYQYINRAIAREKELKNWRRSKKETLILSFNPEQRFLNDDFLLNDDD
jgi:putative endonuclease